MIKGLFITGTDTGVGKTHCAMAVVRELSRRGLDVGVMKPVETGCPTVSGRLRPFDAIRLVEAAGVQDPLSAVNPFRFARPLAPSVAARLDHTSIRKIEILRQFLSLSRLHDLMIVEGAGGILVPLTRRYSFLDLAADMALPVLIVARPALGTINHTLLTIGALQQRKVRIAGIIINHAASGRSGLAERTGPQEIERLSGVPILGALPHGSEKVSRIVDRLLSPRRSGGRG